MSKITFDRKIAASRDVCRMHVIQLGQLVTLCDHHRREAEREGSDLSGHYSFAHPMTKGKVVDDTCDECWYEDRQRTIAAHRARGGLFGSDDLFPVRPPLGRGGYDLPEWHTCPPPHGLHGKEPSRTRDVSGEVYDPGVVVRFLDESGPYNAAHGEHEYGCWIIDNIRAHDGRAIWIRPTKAPGDDEDEHNGGWQVCDEQGARLTEYDAIHGAFIPHHKSLEQAIFRVHQITRCQRERRG